MSTTNKNKKSISETLLEMDELTKAIKKESKETISQLLSETVRGMINEAISVDDEDDEEDYEIEDDATVDTDIEGNDEPEMGVEEAADDAEDDEWKQYTALLHSSAVHRHHDRQAHLSHRSQVKNHLQITSLSRHHTNKLNPVNVLVLQLLAAPRFPPHHK